MAQNLWSNIRGTVQKSLPASAFGAFIEPLCFDKIDLDVLHLSAPSRFAADIIRRDFLSSLLSAARSLNPEIKEVKLSVAEASPSARDDEPGLPLLSATEPSHSEEPLSQSLLSEYSLDAFVPAPSNAFALAAVQQVLAGEQGAYNPLFIHSAPGMGKTHLLQAFAREFKGRVVYMTAERFMTAYVKAVRENELVKFKEAFGRANAIAIDDVHLLAGKDSTSRELAGIIENLIARGGVAVLSANASPFEIEGLSESLKERIAHGLVAGIAPAERELCAGIIDSAKAEIAPEVADFLSLRINSSVRELKGALNRISAHSVLLGGRLDLAAARKALADIIAFNSAPVSIDMVKKAVAKRYGVSMAQLDGARKTKEIALARMVAMHLAKDLTSHSLPEIGRAFGGRSHSTVIHALRRIAGMMAEDSRFSAVVADLAKAI